FFGILSCVSVFGSLRRLPSCSPLFPYTTLFRSLPTFAFVNKICPTISPSISATNDNCGIKALLFLNASTKSCSFPSLCYADANRSEEHTSELQSRFDLVCRLLLEKKN